MISVSKFSFHSLHLSLAAKPLQQMLKKVNTHKKAEF